MTVKELRDYLYKCNDDFIVTNSTGMEIHKIIEHKDLVDNKDSYVELV